MLVGCFDENYIKWAKIYLESLSLTKNNIPVILNSYNIKPKDINFLKSLYNNVTIDNKTLDLKDECKKNNFPYSEMMESKQDCANGKIKGKMRPYMNLMADSLRPIRFLQTIKNNPNENCWIHTDIDFLFRGNISDIVDLVKQHDAVLIVRKWRGKNLKNFGVSDWDRPKTDSMITICFVGINNTPIGIKLTERWIYRINEVPLKDRSHKKWGQHAIARALEDVAKNADVVLPPVGYVNQNLNPAPHAKIWYPKRKNKKNELKLIQKELDRLKTIKR